jgi:succinate-semialdehyde dehydrogenase / glutarate-semialdehyde dehydrogenase
VCANRLFVQDGVYDAFAAKLAQKVKELKVGVGTEGGVNQGPLIDDAALAKVEEHVADALAGGAKALAGGKRHALGGPSTSRRAHRRDADDEDLPRGDLRAGGAALPLQDRRRGDRARQPTPSTASRPTSTARDIGRVWRVAEALEYGMVGVNTGLISTEVAPFGGVKQSGLGREGSKYGIEEFVEVKYICMGGVEAPPWRSRDRPRARHRCALARDRRG